MRWRRRNQETESDTLEETQVWRPATEEELDDTLDESTPLRSERRNQVYAEENWDQDDEEDYGDNEFTENQEDSDQTPIQRRAKYHARMDRFLTNGIIIVGVLLICVLLIAFLV